MASDAAVLRLFAAIVPDTDALAALGRLQGELRRSLAGAPLRWADPDGLHLTLRFYGAVPDQRVAEVESMLGSAASSAAASLCDLQRLGYWPPGAPRLVVAEFSSPPALAALAATLEQRARAAGFAPEPRRFRPHVTLARGPGRALVRAPVDLPAVPLRAGTLALVSSRTLPEGARYQTLRRWTLG